MLDIHMFIKIQTKLNSAHNKSFYILILIYFNIKIYYY